MYSGTQMTNFSDAHTDAESDRDAMAARVLTGS